MLSNPYDKYKTNSVNTATKEELTLMLYDGCLKFITLAKMSIEEKSVEDAHNNIKRVLDIIGELDCTLNMKVNISNDLHRLYDFVNTQLIDADVYKKTEYLDAAKDVMTDIRDGWKDAMLAVKRGH